MRNPFRVLSIVCGLAAIALAFCCLSGCATDPTTGKAVFSPQAAQQLVNSPEAAAAASTLPYGIGALGLAGLSLLFSHMSGTQKTALATQAIQTGANALQTSLAAASSGVVTPPAATAAPPAKS